MTMHLHKTLTTNNTNAKKKKSLTEKDIVRYQQDLKKHNKKMRQIRCHHMQMNLEQYIDYCNGKYKPKKVLKGKEITWRTIGGNVIVKKDNDLPSYKGETNGTCAKPSPKVYTGDKLVGIATMHKSNIVPIFSDENDKKGKQQAADIAHMRRN